MYFWLDAYGVAGEELNEIDDDNEGEEEEPSFTLNEEFLEYLRKSEKRRRGIVNTLNKKSSHKIVTL